MALSEEQFAGWEALMERGRRMGFAALSPDDQVVFHVANLETEVSMGGLESYFETEDADCATRAAAALDAIGAPQSAELLREACALFPGGSAPADTDARREQLAEFTDEQLGRLETLDAAFQARPDGLDARFETFCSRVVGEGAG